MCCFGLLKVVQKLTNFVLLLLGLASIGYSIYLLKIWNDTQSSFKIDEIGKELKQFEQFIILMFVFGIVAFLSSMVGLCCVRNYCCFGTHIILLLVQILFIIIVLIKGVKSFVPQEQKGSTGEWASVENFVRQHEKLTEEVGVVILVVEIIALLSACCSCSRDANQDNSDAGYMPIGNGKRSALNNHANQCNPNNRRYGGYQRGYQGAGDYYDLNNHANQMNPNNYRYM
eukprot:TRINITY_DN1230_c0_g1_i1.p1 TRINITY_DN1230_c0_g1~~TRINITY_DN1230_c0_g1_i1.p1  ORF type:complete len:229 (-),score=13.28 TRINITY_DN1230_c0_g1_i1:268-954(-)